MTAASSYYGRPIVKEPTWTPEVPLYFFAGGVTGEIHYVDSGFNIVLQPRPENLPPGLTPEDALGFVRYLASQSHLQEIHFLWRPFLPDADDDMVLELALPPVAGI